MKTHSEKYLHRIFLLFISLHTLIWTVTPVFIRDALSDDFIEAVSWGHQFAFGYDKNPWVPGFLAHLGIVLGGESGIGIYFIQGLFIAAGFYGVWRLMLRCSGPVYALIAVLMYEACACYSIDLQVYNDNYILMGLLPLASFTLYEAVHRNRWRDWLLSGALTALAIMAKYDAALFALSMLVYLTLHPNRRKFFASPRPYAAMGLAILIMLPNIHWLSQNHFQTLEYAFFERAGLSKHSWNEPLRANLVFALEAAVAFLPTLILAAFAILPLKNTTKQAFRVAQQHGTHDDIAFIFWAGFGPILLLLVLGFGLGLVLHREWGNTFMSFWGAFILLRWHPVVTQAALQRFIAATFAVMLILPAGYLLISLHKDTGNFPAREAAQKAIDIWHRYYKQPLRYVAGDRYTAGHIALYSPDKPALWMEWNSQVSPWIDLTDVRCHGALFVQDSGHTRQHFYQGKKFPLFVRKNFPSLQMVKPIPLQWRRNRLKRPDIIMYIAILPPDKKACRTPA